MLNDATTIRARTTTDIRTELRGLESEVYTCSTKRGAEWAQDRIQRLCDELGRRGED